MAIKTFTTGEVLTAADTNTYLANSGLVYVATKVFTSTADNIVGCFTSTYDNYRIVISNITVSLGGQLQGRMLSGTSPLSTNTYETQRLSVQSSTITAGGTAGVPTNVGYIGFTSTEASGGAGFATIEIANPMLSRYTTWEASSVNQNAYIDINYAIVKNTTAYDGFQLRISAGTFDGTATVYGYRKA